MSDDGGWENYDSGPFCVHWFDPSECEQACAACGHMCKQHQYGRDACNVINCECQCVTQEVK